MKIKTLLGMMILCFATASQAATFYVKPGGSDAADCASWDTACASIAGAIGKAAANDSIYIAKGIYRLSSTISANKSLSFIGGFDINGTESTGDKYSTVITGDTANDDSVDSYGITRSYTGIAGTNVAQGFAISNGNYVFRHLTITGMRGAQDDAHGPAIVFAGSSTVANTVRLDDVGIVGNIAHSLGNVMAYATDTGSVFVTVENSVFENNRGDAGSGLTLHINASAEIVNSQFLGNVAETDDWGWSSGHGAVYAQGVSDLTIRDSVFANNTAVQAAAVFANRNLSVSNTTFANNTSSGCGGALVISTSGIAELSYSSFFQNQAASCGAGVQHANTAAGSLNLLANLLLSNKIGSVETNINAPNGAIVDNGYNLFGYGSVSGVNGTFVLAATSSVPAGQVDDIVVGAGYQGGNKPSVKITKTSPARNAIPNDGVPFYGVGKSVNYPFVSLQQARGALTREDYSAGIYYFDLGSSYTVVEGDIAFTPGHTQFSTYVDGNGYVLIASADKISVVAGAYASVYALDRRSDAILPAAVLTHADFVFDEVRISSYSGGDRGTFDGYNKSAEAIAKIKQFQTVPNASEPGGDGWVVTHSSSGNNYFLGNARPAGTGDGEISRSLDLEIYHSSGVGGGIHWIPSRPNEALNWPNGSPGDFSDDLDLWVRNSAGLCDGSVASTDSRGLPRSDKVSAEDPVSNCDIGAFEYNDFYRLDCLDEDGLRPENSLESAQVSWCFSDPTALTPRDILDNIGSSNGLLLIIPGLLLVLRRRRQQ